MAACVHTHTYMCARVRIRVHICACVSTCVHMFTCVRVHICVLETGLPPGRTAMSPSEDPVLTTGQDQGQPRPSRQAAAVRRQGPVSGVGVAAAAQPGSGSGARAAGRRGARTRFSTSSIEGLSDVFSCLCGARGGDAVRPAVRTARARAEPGSPAPRPESQAPTAGRVGAGPLPPQGAAQTPHPPSLGPQGPCPQPPRVLSVSDVTAHGTGAGASTWQRAPGAPRPLATPTQPRAGQAPSPAWPRRRRS